MNILLVDDENYVIESMKQKINWDEFPVEEIYTANTTEQAKTLLSMLSIQIIISDIVMPGGTGLDFVDWVRENNYPVQVIFLTSYAEFDYAKQAVALDSVDYLLKPIDILKLESALTRAVTKCQREERFEEYRHESLKWKHSKRLIHENFLKSVLQKEWEGHREKMDQTIEEQNLDYMLQDQFLPICMHLSCEHKKQWWNDQLLGFILKNVLGETLQTTWFTVETAFQESCGRYILILKKNRTQKEQEFELGERYEIFLTWVKQKLNSDIWCGIGTLCSLENLLESVSRIRQMWEETLTMKNCVLWVETYEKKEVIYTNPYLQVWKALLAEKEREELTKQMEKYLSEMDSKLMVTHENLIKFRMDVVQMVYSYLTGQEITAHLLFSSKDSEELYKEAVEGVQEARNFVRHFVQKALDYTDYANQTTSVVGEMKKYIDSHYQEDIRRSTLVDLVFLNEDYISRIFKKEAGMSISSYLIQKRVEVAKSLLISSSLPINTVSIHVGYSNFSYFTKMFRENTGCSPLEYRRNMKI